MWYLPYHSDSQIPLIYVRAIFDKVCFVLQDFDGGIDSIFDCINYGSKSITQTVYFSAFSCLVFFTNTKSFFSFLYAFRKYYEYNSRIGEINIRSYSTVNCG